MGKFKNMVVESEHFDQVPPPKRVADLGVEPMPYYDRPKVIRALESLEWARIATPSVSRRAETLFLVRSLEDQGATWEDYEALIAFGWTREEIWAAADELEVDL